MTTIDYQGQQDRVKEFIRHNRRVVWLEESETQRGYFIRKPGGTRRGFVRYNVAGSNADRFTIYAF